MTIKIEALKEIERLSELLNTFESNENISRVYMEKRPMSLILDLLMEINSEEMLEKMRCRNDFLAMLINEKRRTPYSEINEFLIEELSELFPNRNYKENFNNMLSNRRDLPKQAYNLKRRNKNRLVSKEMETLICILLEDASHNEQDMEQFYIELMEEKSNFSDKELYTQMIKSLSDTNFFSDYINFELISKLDQVVKENAYCFLLEEKTLLEEILDSEVGAFDVSERLKEVFEL